MSTAVTKIRKPRGQKRTDLKAGSVTSAAQKISSYQKFYKSDVILIASAIAGISSHAISDMIRISEKPIEEIASLLYVTPRTIKNYQNGNKNLTKF